MKRHIVARLAVIVAWLICLLPAPAQGDQGDRGGVLDEAHVLSADGIAAIATEIDKADAAGVSVDVLLLDRLEDSIERVARQHAAEWTPKHNKAAVLVIAIGDRQSRLEVNDALRPQLPDARSQFALDSARPFLRDKNYSGAIVYVIGQVTAAASGVSGPAEDPTGETVQRNSQNTAAAAAHHTYPEDRGNGWMIFGLVLCIITVIAALIGHTRYTRQLLVVDGQPRVLPYWRHFLGGYGAFFSGLLTTLGWIVKFLGESNGSSYSSSSTWSSSSSRSSSSSSSSRSSSGGFSGGGASSSW